ncbi:RING-H2 finger protein ATL18-like [Humulus lupulus]|uniref:RING-H2 finger protein ATL18-like n=1 Tax=Humulus lupulus TaxID=3486 RepID=UPI002B402B8E|nr:RING-H2 finger protein ATL18-like [Humulus lupulus]
MANADDPNSQQNFITDPTLRLLLILVVTVAFVISVYRLIIVCRRLRLRRQLGGSRLNNTANSRVPIQLEPPPHPSELPMMITSPVMSMVELVPHDNEKIRGGQKILVREHGNNDVVCEKTGEGRMVGNDALVCAVCLSEFEEKEELRILPECLHSFHKPCIDMWLFSHSTCPICRTESAVLSPLPPPASRQMS